MRIAIVSDTHDNDDTVNRVVDRLRQRGVELVLHCGDISLPQTVHRFAGISTHFVFGNWDGDFLPQGRFRRVPCGSGGRNRDRSQLRQAIEEVDGVVHEPWGELELEGRSIAWTHGHDREVLRDLEQADVFDFLFYGHTHEQEQHRTGRTLVVNPGAVYRASRHTFAILDLPEGSIDIVTVA